MREIIFCGKRKDNGEWVQGDLRQDKDLGTTYINGWDYYVADFALQREPYEYEVIPETVGQYTGMTEFVVTDKNYNVPLFENNIVEVWSRRRPLTENIVLYRDYPSSQHDVEMKARAVICFKHGEWQLDYDNEYNNSLCELKGNEQVKRTVVASTSLYAYGFHRSNEDWYREHNSRYKWKDIIKIGNVYDNPELLRGSIHECINKDS